MRVLVTGGSGYLGKAVVRTLLAAGHHVGVLVHRTEAGLPGDAEPHHGDLLDPDTLLPAVRGADAVVHLAAITRVRESIAHPARYYRLNVGGTANLLEALGAAAASKTMVPRFVFASTGSVYGAQVQQPIDERVVPQPANPYTASKFAGEQLVGWQAATGLLAAASLRIFNVAGADSGHGDTDDTRLIPCAVAAAAGRIPRVDVYGDGSAVRDYVHVSDVARAFLSALEAVAPGVHDVFNVGATAASTNDVIEAVAEAAGARVPVQHHPPHPGELHELRSDSSLIRRRLDWMPQRSAIARIAADQWAATGHI